MKTLVLALDKNSWHTGHPRSQTIRYEHASRSVEYRRIRGEVVFVNLACDLFPVFLNRGTDRAISDTGNL